MTLHSYADNVVFFPLETVTFPWRLALVSSYLSTLEIDVLGVRGNRHQEVTDDQRLCCTLPGQKDDPDVSRCDSSVQRRVH